MSSVRIVENTYQCKCYKNSLGLQKNAFVANLCRPGKSKKMCLGVQVEAPMYGFNLIWSLSTD